MSIDAATKAMLELKLKTGKISVDEYQSELSRTSPRTLAEQAYDVWCAACFGRRAARNGYRSSGLCYLDVLAQYRNEKHPRLNQIAADAANGIRAILDN